MTADTAAALPICIDLPSDLLRGVSCRLHAAADYVRFHAVCWPWREALPPARSRPTFLPWLLSPRDAATTSHRKARCVFTSFNSSLVSIRDLRFAASLDGGAAACLLKPRPEESTATGGLIDPLFGSASSDDILPPYSDEIQPWAEHAAGVVSGDGTAILFAFGYFHGAYAFNAALLRPGDTAWTSVRREGLYFIRSETDRCGMASRHRHGGGMGKVMLCDEYRWFLVPTQAGAAIAAHEWGWLPDELGNPIKTGSASCKDALLFGGDVGGDSLAGALLLSVYTLRGEESGEPRWMKGDGRSLLSDRVLFLGRPSSFAVDAALLGMDGGCAYFVGDRLLYGRISRKVAIKGCHLFRYSFHDDRSEVVEKLSDVQNNGVYMWVTPRPAISNLYRGNQGMT
ncbi:unnamed protein product [Urochloa decumbens]|uniref:DUF295 domain-containing protein n=1 Tax=Urochloa decumbens TaxID=240449 RepID=A0ABC9GV18_9POAL